MIREIKSVNVMFFTVAMLLLSSFAAASNVVSDVERYEAITLPDTQVRHIHSRFTHQNYKIYISIPVGYYQNIHKHYASIFLLDADYSFPIAKGITEHLSDRHRTSDRIIFGIAYDGPLQYKLNRTRDYTPTHVATGGYGKQYQAVSGGGPAFMKFIQKELIPYLSHNYRLSSERTLVGHSYGGLFAAWVLLNHPNVFSNYIIVSPSLWYDHHKLMNQENRLLKNKHAKPVHAFFGIGSKENAGSYKMIDDLNAFTAKLLKQHKKNLSVKTVVFSGEDHDTVFPVAFTRGLN
ncbi:MAG: alpha/beta hydrolase-fold protein [Coxiellaceae bacterium]|nr:alpha/beta hydrolase-fold protein [Coxiellaceae bacterium]